jgi:Leucine-rich repeat (LRR) protein
MQRMIVDFTIFSTGKNSRVTLEFVTNGRECTILTGTQKAPRRHKFYLDAPRVTKLNLSSNGLDTLPDDMAKLVVMREFRASQNYLTTLPSVMEKLTALRTLELRENQFTKFPREILALKNLSVLDMSMNDLTVLPRELCTLDKMEEMYVCDNLLSWLPVELGSWTASLYMYGNNFPSEAFAGQHVQCYYEAFFRITKHIGMIRYAAGTVCIAMQNLNLPALLTLLVIDELFENDIRMWAKWELITSVKHFHDRHD